MVETEPTGSRKLGFAKTFDHYLLSVVFIFENVHDSPKHQSAFFKSFTSGRDTFVIFFASVRNDVVSGVTTKCATKLAKFWV